MSRSLGLIVPSPAPQDCSPQRLWKEACQEWVTCLSTVSPCLPLLTVSENPWRAARWWLDEDIRRGGSPGSRACVTGIGLSLPRLVSACPHWPPLILTPLRFIFSGKGRAKETESLLCSWHRTLRSSPHFTDEKLRCRE